MAVRPLVADIYDVIVVGAGVVGCAVARKLTLEGARVIILEKGLDILDGASKANSALLHTGFDAPPGSIEQRCIADGYHEFLKIRQQLNLPLIDCGALVIAWNEDEHDKLESIIDKSHANGVTNTRIVSAREVSQMEPDICTGAIAAVQVPGESIIDPWNTPFAYLLQALSNGARAERNCEVTGGEFDGIHWVIDSSCGRVTGKCVINCAGLFGDELNNRLIDEPLFNIRPRKGQFVVYDKSAAKLIRSILLPVPGERTKGVVVCRTIFGNLLVGPTAEEQQSRVDVSVDKSILNQLTKRGEQIVPALSGHSVTATYAGIRPATDSKDYHINSKTDLHYISVGGIRSTGLSAALGIANLVFDHYSKLGEPLDPLDPPDRINWPQINSISEYDKRDWQCDDNGGIVCHCELVTQREIAAAMTGPLAVRSLDGLKRRTRVTMGRCQGFYCTARLCELTAGQFDRPLCVSSDT
ncbi:MAG: FAD/NAD(P)-binding oxidoreductase [marine bacterium B5-7]|nr:MAG: FAD/NAD(P)-binding oxidoreductase [marine bacterium B5-7]